MSNAINSRLSLISSYYTEIDALIAMEKRILDTYEGMLAQSNNGDGVDYLFDATSRLAALRCDRAEIDHMWNETLLAFEAS
jgi:hypothetical protein